MLILVCRVLLSPQAWGLERLVVGKRSTVDLVGPGNAAAVGLGWVVRSTQVGSIVHATPGRIRLRVAREHRAPETFREIEGLLKALPGVEAISVTESTGSVLVKYDPATLDVEHLLRMSAELGWAAPASAASARSGIISRQLSLPPIDRARLMKSVALLGVAGLGGLAGPALGVSARLGSVIASVAFVVIQRQAARIHL
jgi:hypothetical protein